MIYKATRPDGTDFRTGTLDYAAACGTGKPVIWTKFRGGKPGRMVKDDPATYISLSSEPGKALTGGKWPCRLFEAEPVGRTMGHTTMGFKVCCRQVLVVAELPAHLALGPNGEAVAALIEHAGRLTAGEASDLAAARDGAWDAARDAAWDAARDGAWAAARDAAWAAARDAAGAAAWDAAGDAAGAAARDGAWDAARDAAGAAARDAAGALLVRDLITPAQFDLLYGPWAAVIGAAA